MTRSSKYLAEGALCVTKDVLVSTLLDVILWLIVREINYNYYYITLSGYFRRIAAVQYTSECLASKT